MGTRQDLVKHEAARKGRHAAIAGGVTAGLFALTLGLPLVPWIVLLGGGAYTGKQVYDWLRFRGKWGLRF